MFDEKQIITQLADPGKKRAAFTAIVNHYSEPLYWKVRRIVLTHEDANDVLQNVFLKAWNSLGDFQNKSKFSTCIRKQKLTASISADEDLSVANKLMADEYFDGDETQALLQEAISRLPDVQRMVFNLRYYDEMKYSEISNLLNTSEGALKASYHLAVKKITEYFKLRD